MKEHQHISIKRSELDNSTPQNATDDNLQSLNNKEVKSESKIIRLSDKEEINRDAEIFLFKRREAKIKNESSDLLVQNNPETKTSATPYQNVANLFRLFVKNGEYVYARPNDIIMMESCDHLVKVYLAFNDKIKKTIRHNTLKDLLLQLPQDQFMRIGRFCAVNIHRLSGGNCNEQTFEFDFRVSIKLKHDISQAAFGNIGK